MQSEGEEAYHATPHMSSYYGRMEGEKRGECIECGGEKKQNNRNMGVTGRLSEGSPTIVGISD